MCEELTRITTDDLPSIDPLEFMRYHQRALPPQFLFTTLSAIDNAESGKPVTIEGFDVTPEDVLGPFKDRLLARINEKFCYE